MVCTVAISNLLKSLIIVVALLQNGYGLVCLESTEINGDVVIEQRNSSMYKYCAMAPKGLDLGSEVRLFPMPVDSDSMIENYDQIFAQDEAMFQTLTICLFERYSVKGHEFLMRCMCNYDRCNDARSMRSFLNKLAVNSVRT